MKVDIQRAIHTGIAARNVMTNPVAKDLADLSLRYFDSEHLAEAKLLASLAIVLEFEADVALEIIADTVNKVGNTIFEVGDLAMNTEVE